MALSPSSMTAPTPPRPILSSIIAHPNGNHWLHLCPPSLLRSDLCFCGLEAGSTRLAWAASTAGPSQLPGLRCPPRLKQTQRRRACTVVVKTSYSGTQLLMQPMFTSARGVRGGPGHWGHGGQADRRGLRAWPRTQGVKRRNTPLRTGGDSLLGSTLPQPQPRRNQGQGRQDPHAGRPGVAPPLPLWRPANEDKRPALGAGLVTERGGASCGGTASGLCRLGQRKDGILAEREVRETRRSGASRTLRAQSDLGPRRRPDPAVPAASGADSSPVP